MAIVVLAIAVFLRFSPLLIGEIGATNAGATAGRAAPSWVSVPSSSGRSVQPS